MVGCVGFHSSSSSLLLSSLELSDTKVYEHQIRALLGTALHFCEAVVLKLFHSVEFEGFVTSDIRGLRDQICTTFSPKVDCVRQVDFR